MKFNRTWEEIAQDNKAIEDHCNKGNKELTDFLKYIRECISKKMDETKMTQENKPVPHVHYDKIMEWALDPSAVWQEILIDGYRDIAAGGKPAFHPEKQYRRKPRWFDMEQEWIARGKPPVEYISAACGGRYVFTPDPLWCDQDEYRFKPTPHPCADVLRALAEDKNLSIEFEAGLLDGSSTWVYVDLGRVNLRIKP